MTLRLICGWLTVAMLWGCGAAGPPAIAPTEGSGDAAASWMAPAAQRQDLLYISLVDPNEHVVLAYSYRHRTLLGTLTGFEYPQALCVDPAQDLYVTDNARYQISEFRHGGTKRIKVLVDPAGSPLGCAVDPSSGDLAVANFNTKSGGGNLVVYRHARGIPRVYVNDVLYYYWFPVYDGAGNLFVDGLNEQGSSVGLAELPVGGHKLRTLKVDQTIEYPGGMFWDGRYLAVGDQGAGAVYEFAISKFNATLEKTTSLGEDLFEFWISPNDAVLVGAVYGNKYCIGSAVYFWRYPKGGSPRHTIGDVPCASGLVVSQVSKGAGGPK